MAELVVAAAGAAIGGYAIPGTIFGLSGASIGWTVGSLIGSAFGPKQKSSGPRQEDLKVTGSGYGQPVPWVAGSPRVGGAIIWASNKRETATTTEVGKGGGSEYTEYTYDCDVLYMLSENEIVGVSRIWSNGKLVYDGAALQSGFCDSIAVYTGEETQLPDPIYEAAVGVGNAPAYRTRGTVMIAGLKLGNGGFLPNLTFEIGTTQVDANVRLLNNYADFNTEDLSSFQNGEGTITNGQVNENFFKLDYQNYAINAQNWTTDVLDCPDGSIQTYEVIFNYQVTPSGNNAQVPLFDFKLTEGIGANTSRVFAAITGLENFSIIQENGGISSPIYYDSSVDGINVQTGGDIHVAVEVDRSTATNKLSFWLAGVRKRNGVTYNFGEGSSSTAFFAIGGDAGATRSVDLRIKGIRITRGRLYSTASFTPPTAQELVDDVSGVGNQTPIPLPDVVNSLMLRASYEVDEYDISGIEGSEEAQIRAMYLTQVAPTRTALEVLQSAYYLTWSKSDKIYFRYRQVGTQGTFDIEDLGVSDSPEGSDNPFPIKNTNQIERPAQISLTYNNMALDFNQAVVSSDILTTPQKSTNAVQIPLGLAPTVAQGIVESMLLDQEAAKVQYGPFRVPLSYAQYEPSDVVIIPDTEGAEHRVRLVKKTDMGIMLEFEGVGDDEGALIAAGLGDDTDQGQTVVEQPSGSLWVAGDWPLMRDADNSAGYLTVAKSDEAGDFWPGAQFVRSWDDVSFAQVATFTTGCLFGTCTTTLPDFTAGNVWDESSVLRVSVGSGELSSSTKAAMQTDLTINTAMVGSECIRFRTATLVSPGVYDLNSLIRGFRGTEWAKGSHVASEDFVLLDSATRRVDLNTGQIGVDQYVKAVTFNLPLSSETSELFTYTGVNLKPFSVANLRCLETSDGDLDLTWDRRTRLSYAYGGTIGSSVPLGEATELYRVYVYDGSNLVRTEEVTAQEFLYTAAMATADGFVSSDAVTFEVVQVSEIVGDGYSEEIQGVIP